MWYVKIMIEADYVYNVYLIIHRFDRWICLARGVAYVGYVALSVPAGSGWAGKPNRGNCNCETARIGICSPLKSDIYFRFVRETNSNNRHQASHSTERMQKLVKIGRELHMWSFNNESVHGQTHRHARVSTAADRPAWCRGSAHARYSVSHHMVIKPFLLLGLAAEYRCEFSAFPSLDEIYSTGLHLTWYQKIEADPECPRTQNRVSCDQLYS